MRPIAAGRDDVANVDANAKNDALLQGDRAIAFRHAVLAADDTTHVRGGYM